MFFDYQIILPRHNNYISWQVGFEVSSNPFDPKLKPHKLKGILEGSWACSVDYHLRIVFELVKNQATNEDEILLTQICH